MTSVRKLSAFTLRILSEIFGTIFGALAILATLLTGGWLASKLATSFEFWVLAFIGGCFLALIPVYFALRFVDARTRRTS